MIEEGKKHKTATKTTVDLLFFFLKLSFHQHSNRYLLLSWLLLHYIIVVIIVLIALRVSTTRYIYI